MKAFTLVTLLLASSFLNVIAEESASPLITGAVVETFKKTPQTDLQIHRLDPPGYNPTEEKRPALVLFFGGGWVSGEPTHLEPQARYFAERGLIVFLPDYRTRKKYETTPRECVEDAKSAIRWVRENADRLGVDPDRIAAGGGSAGGHVAAAAGMCDGFEAPDENLEISSKTGPLVLFNPVYDNSPDGYGHDRVTEWFPAISPAHNITKDDPPAIVFLGTNDKLIKTKSAEDFQAEQKKLGIRSNLHLYENEGHGFFNLGRGKIDYFSDTVLKADAFLCDLGYLTGKPDPALLDQIIAGEKK